MGPAAAPPPVPPAVARAAERYVALADRLLPGALTGYYLVGSVALGAYRPGRSDIDFVAVLDGPIGPETVRRLRALHALSGATTAATAVRRGRSPLSGTCNGLFVRARDLATPVTDIVPVASHVGTTFTVARAGSALSPVDWKVLAERGVPVRGPAPAGLGLEPQPELLTDWNLGNLDAYWRPWAERVRRTGGRRPFRARPRWSTAWGMLGAPRLHCTIATGEVVAKERAGEYALDVFPARWHPLLADALAYRRREPSRLRLPATERGRRTAEFVLEVVASARHAAGTASRGR